ncbi:hypothetical protein PVAP13_9NG586814 [Panicum virgatum]|uniref:Uncharacterized protein n=1 Tax=Panicum virgatum TaxID=38727 RepID=A0A8T0MWE5_PANVG|nr:hypothetical protein PVAP13_9NG586814 [Panicum virgatum]
MARSPLAAVTPCFSTTPRCLRGWRLLFGLKQHQRAARFSLRNANAASGISDETGSRNTAIRRRRKLNWDSDDRNTEERAAIEPRTGVMRSKSSEGMRVIRELTSRRRGSFCNPLLPFPALRSKPRRRIGSGGGARRWLPIAF